MKFFTRMVEWLYRLLPFALPLYLIRFHVLGLPTTLLEMYLGVLLLSFTFVYRTAGWRMAWRRAGDWRYAIIAWALVGLLAAFVSPRLWTGLGLWRAYILEPMLVFVTFFVALESEKSRQSFIASLFGVCWVVVAWGLVQFVSGKGIPHPWNVSIAAGRRATGPYPFPNALALFVTPIGVLAMGEWLKRPRNWFALLTSLVCVLGIALAKSDGGAIAFMVATGLILCTRRWGRCVVAAGIILGVIGLFLEPVVRMKVWHVFTFQEWSGKVRLFMWRETWAMLKDHWLFGAGLGGYPVVFDAYHKARFIEIFQYPHTILFNVWTETGLLGVFVFLGIIATWIKRSLHVITPSKARMGVIVMAIAPLVAILVHGLVDVPYFKNDLALVFWMLAFLCLPSSSFPINSSRENSSHLAR